MNTEQIHSNSLITKLLEHKYRTKCTNIELGVDLKLSNVYVCLLLNRRVQPSKAVSFRVKEFLESIDASRTRQKQQAVDNEDEDSRENPRIDKCKAPKITIQVKGNDESLKKISHKKTPKAYVSKVTARK